MINVIFVFFFQYFIISLRYINPHLLNIQLIQEHEQGTRTVILAPITGDGVERLAFLMNTSTTGVRMFVAPTSVAGQGGDAARDYDMTHSTAVYM